MQRKIHNQTLFVAALSVYLGLLIAGAPPQVLAQAALTTKLEEAKTERLQTKEPDEDDFCVGLHESAQTQLKKDSLKLETISEFISLIQALSLEANNKLPFEYFTLNYHYFRGGQNTGIVPTQSYSTDGKNLLEVVKPFRQTLQEKGTKFSEFFPPRCCDRTNFQITAQFGATEVNAKAKFPIGYQELSQSFARSYHSGLEFLRCQKRNLPEAVIYQNTEATSENDQVFIVTRLPRAGLYALLKARTRRQIEFGLF
jgi:hypothetical protein